jgi:type I restriction-modification system DNA methylase subunit
MEDRVMEKHLVISGETLDDIIKTYNNNIDNIEDFRKVVYLENKDIVTKDYQVNTGEYILVPSEKLISKN